MKKVTSILLVILLLYNMLGYYVFVAFKQMEVKDEVTIGLQNKNITDKDLIVFKVPVPLYHQIDRDFEKVEGDFEFQGQYYDMVKQKLENDTLLVYCYNNEKKEKIYADLSEHTKIHVIDFKGKKGENEKLFKSFLKEYVTIPSHEIIFSFSISSQNINCFPSDPAVISIIQTVKTPPPELA